MVKQARQRALEAGPRTTLIDLWRGDQQEVVAAFLHLNDIATVPMLSRRFRDQQPLVLLRLARRHGCARAMIGASLNEIAATGRDWSLFSGDSVGAWRPLPAAGDDGDCFAVSMGQGQANYVAGSPYPSSKGVTVRRYIEINTNGQSGHGGGLVKTFDAADRLCVRQLKYRFRFTDPNPEASHADPGEYGFAYFAMGGVKAADSIGLFVYPTESGYELTWFNPYNSDTHDEDDDNAIMSVVPGRWYDVRVNFNWATDDDYDYDRFASVACRGPTGDWEGATLHTERRVLCSRQPLSVVKLYNFSPGVAHYSDIQVKYSPHTPRDGDVSWGPDSDDADSSDDDDVPISQLQAQANEE